MSTHHPSPSAAQEPYPVPPEESARRLEWAHLAPYVRDHITERCGAEVLGVESIESGFTPGFATVITCVDGSQHFVKAAAKKAQRAAAASYAAEVAHLLTLPADVPAPRLLWNDEDDDWIVFATEYVEGAGLPRPWTQEALDACLDALEHLVTECTPAPRAMALPTLVAETASWSGAWEQVIPPTAPERAEEARTLAEQSAQWLTGTTLLHADLRADNVLIDVHGAAWFCDWSWPATGPAWVDAYTLLAAARGDGVDVESTISSRPWLAQAPAEGVDSLLALMAGYFLRAGCEPVPPNSPHVRDHQYWTGTSCWLWLADRRGW